MRDGNAVRSSSATSSAFGHTLGPPISTGPTTMPERMQLKTNSTRGTHTTPRAVRGRLRAGAALFPLMQAVVARHTDSDLAARRQGFHPAHDGPTDLVAQRDLAI